MTKPQAVTPSLLSGQALSAVKGLAANGEILRCAQDDRQDTVWFTHIVRGPRPLTGSLISKRLVSFSLP